MKVFTVYDSKAEGYMNPFYVKSRGEAIRSFTEIANDKSHQIGKYPADFTLFELGEWDENTSKFTLHSTPTSIGLALDFVDVQKPASVKAVG